MAVSALAAFAESAALSLTNIFGDHPVGLQAETMSRAALGEMRELREYEPRAYVYDEQPVTVTREYLEELRRPRRTSLTMAQHRQIEGFNAEMRAREARSIRITQEQAGGLPPRHLPCRTLSVSLDQPWIYDSGNPAFRSASDHVIPDAVQVVLTSPDAGGNVRHVSGELTAATSDEGTNPMPRARNRQACECGCGEMTETGKYKRGHATRVRWQAIKAVVNDGGEIAGRDATATRASEVLRDKGWRIPASHRTFGIEIECIGSPTRIAAAFAAARIPYTTGYRSAVERGAWKQTSDGSIQYRHATGDPQDMQGVEIVSPPLHGRKGERMIERVMKLLNAAGCRVVASCGTHVHQEARDLTLRGMQLAVTNYQNARHRIDEMVAASRRGIANTYCLPWREAELTNLRDAAWVEDTAYSQGDKYRAVNLKSYPRFGTVEFRQHQGTLSAAKAVAWIRFSRQMLDAASRGVEISGTPASLPAMLTAIRLDVPTISYLDGRTRQLAAVA